MAIPSQLLRQCQILCKEFLSNVNALNFNWLAVLAEIGDYDTGVLSYELGLKSIKTHRRNCNKAKIAHCTQIFVDFQHSLQVLERCPSEES